MRFILSLAALSLLVPLTTFAHVVVKPSEVGIGSFQTFTVGAPTEKDVDVIGLRLVLPEGGLQHVHPNVKPGWTIEVKTAGEGEEAPATEILWTGGVVPPEQRDDFMFSAKVPDAPTTLTWKAYQTYADGTIVAWDVDPKTAAEATSNTEEDANKPGPASVTSVIDDLSDSETGELVNKKRIVDMLPLALSTLALALSLIAIMRKR
jgi:uncharacterized protein YcnI